MSATIGQVGRTAGLVTIVTGAASGLGAAYAQALHGEGAQLILTDIDQEKGRAVSSALPGSIFFFHDVRDEKRWRELVSEARDRFGRVDALINNAGLVRFGSIEDCTLEDYRLLHSVMSEGTFLGCKTVVPLMAHGGGGSIINTASVAAIQGKSLIPAYSAAKGAIISLTRSVAAHCLERGYRIRCNVLLPGGHQTPMATYAREALRHLPERSQPGVLAEVAQGHVTGRPDDLAKLIVFLVSPESIGMTGASMIVDNGETLK